MKNLCKYGNGSALLVILAVALFVSIFSIGGNVKSVNATGTYIHWYNITASGTDNYETGFYPYEYPNYEDARSAEIADFGQPDFVAVGQANASTTYQILRSSVVFDVSSLAGVNWAALKYASMQINPSFVDYYPDNLFNLTLQHSSTTGIPKCNQTGLCSPEDYNMSWYSGDDGSVNASTLIISGWNNPNSFNLTANGVTYVQSVLSGDSIARWILRSSDDINDIAPVDIEYEMTFNSAPYQPFLCIGIEEPNPPPDFYYFNLAYKDQTGITTIPTSEITTHWYNGSQTINYVLGESTLLSGTYTVNLSYKYFDLGNYTFDTSTSGNSTISITLPMLAWNDGYIVVEPNDGHITINSQDDTSLNFTVSGGTPPYNVTIASFSQEPTTVTFNNTDINYVYAIGQETVTINNVSSDGTFYIEKASGHGNNPSGNGNGGGGGGGGSWGQAFSNLVNEIVKFLRKIPTWAVWLLILLLGLVAIGGMTADKTRGQRARKPKTPVRGGV